MGRGWSELTLTRILASGFSAVAQGWGCCIPVACIACHPHLGSGDQHSQHLRGTAHCLASSGREEAASLSSSAHRQCSYFYIHTCVCPGQRERKKGQAKYSADIKIVFQATFWNVGKISLGIPRNGQTGKLLLTTWLNRLWTLTLMFTFLNKTFCTSTWVLCWIKTKA